ncbi:MAG: hypothetical protein HY718_06395, partial [Planctomycetes bacterium]|nr:hypothetical protein [Planctomycetota bacterium]
MGNRKKDRKGRGERKRIERYKRTGKKLQPPLATYPGVKQVDYHRQLLPQLLWLESLLDLYGENRLPGIVYPFLDLVDALGTTGPDPVSGLVESFAFVPAAKRQSFVSDNRSVVEIAVIKPFLSALHLYRDCPMNWLMASYEGAHEDCDLDSAITSVKKWTASLLDRVGEHSNMVRAIVFARYLKA